MDLLQALSKAERSRDASFDYTVHLNESYGGVLLDENGYYVNGVIGELDLGIADIAVGALSINPERERYVDFSEPWLYHGIRVLEKWVGS